MEIPKNVVTVAFPAIILQFFFVAMISIGVTSYKRYYNQSELLLLKWKSALFHVQAKNVPQEIDVN